MNRKRIRFEKYGRLKFIGHLDILRSFQRIIRRAALPISYSQGFSPHQLIAFANPLGLGLTSEDEYMEIQLDDPVSNEEVIERLNQACPEGIHITGCWDMPDGMPAAMAVVSAASYRIQLPAGIENWAETIRQFMDQPQIMLQRFGKVKGRKQLIEVDCKPLIYAWSVDDNTTMTLTCACGSTENLKVDSLLEVLYKWMEKPELQFEEQIHRTHLYQNIDGQFHDLSEMKL